MASLKLYGAPLSAPFRSVAWTMLQVGVPFDIELTIPGLDAERGSRHDEFRDLTPHRASLIPILKYVSANETEELSPRVLVESASIMTHLCERYGGQAMGTDYRSGPVLYPEVASLEKAMVDSYMHWHDSHTRFVANKIIPRINPFLELGDTSEADEKIDEILAQLDEGWLHSDDEYRPYIGGLTEPTIADLMAYSEIGSVTMTKVVSLQNYSRLQAWTERMAELPFHDDVHQSIILLGSMADVDLEGVDAEDVGERIKAATIGGLKSISAAQSAFATVADWEV